MVWKLRTVSRQFVHRVISLVVVAGPLTCSAFEAPRFGMLPSELSDQGYIRVVEKGVFVPVRNVHDMHGVGDKLPLIQKNQRYYIALKQYHDGFSELSAYPRVNYDGDGTAWVTEQHDLIFGAESESSFGRMYLRPSEVLPIAEVEEEHYIVTCERYGRIFSLQVPKTTLGIQFQQTLPDHVVQLVEQRNRLEDKLAQVNLDASENGGVGDPTYPTPQTSTISTEKIEAAIAAVSPRALEVHPAILHATHSSGSVTDTSPFALGSDTRTSEPDVARPANGSPVIAPDPPPLLQPTIDLAVGPEPGPASPGADGTATRATGPDQTVALSVPDLDSGSESPHAADRPEPEEYSTRPEPVVDVVEAEPVPGTGEESGAESIDTVSVPTESTADPLPVEGPEPSPIAEPVTVADTTEPPVAEPAPVDAAPYTGEAAPDEAAVADTADAPPPAITVAILKLLGFLCGLALAFIVLVFALARIVNRKGAGTVENPPEVAEPPPVQPAHATAEPPSADLPDTPAFQPAQDHVAVEAEESKQEGEFEKDKSGTFTGSLHGFDISELIQFLNASKETGTLSITENDSPNQSKVMFNAGEIVNALCAGANGDEALGQILSFTDGFFVFKRQLQSTTERTITQSTMSLLMNLHKVKDEGSVPAEG